jgi:hypothetical protein
LGPTDSTSITRGSAGSFSMPGFTSSTPMSPKISTMVVIAPAVPSGSARVHEARSR